MEKENLHDEIVIDEGRKQYKILTFQDFVLEEGKKGKETKKNRPIKNREEFTMIKKTSLIQMITQNVSSNFVSSL